MTKVSRCHSGVHKLRCGGCQGNVSLKHNSVNDHCFHRQKSPPATTLLPALHRKHHLWFSPESFPNKLPGLGITRNLLFIYEVNQTTGAGKHTETSRWTKEIFGDSRIYSQRICSQGFWGTLRGGKGNIRWQAYPGLD